MLDVALRTIINASNFPVFSFRIWLNIFLLSGTGARDGVFLTDSA